MKTPRLTFSLLSLVCATTLSHAASLKHRYEFNGNLNDSVGSAHATGTSFNEASVVVAYGAARPPGASGPVASVQLGQTEGKTSGFSLPDSLMPRAGSLSFWFKADRANAGEGADYLLNVGGTYNKDLRVSIASKEEHVQANVANTNTRLGKITAGTWHHVAITWDEAASSARLYFNGTLVRTRQWDDVALFSPTRIRIGNWAFSKNYLNNQFQGAIYDLQLYVGQFSDEDVKQLFAAPGSTLSAR